MLSIFLCVNWPFIYLLWMSIQVLCLFLNCVGFFFFFWYLQVVLIEGGLKADWEDESCMGCQGPFVRGLWSTFHLSFCFSQKEYFVLAVCSHLLAFVYTLPKTWTTVADFSLSAQEPPSTISYQNSSGRTVGHSAPHHPDIDSMWPGLGPSSCSHHHGTRDWLGVDMGSKPIHVAVREKSLIGWVAQLRW